MYRATHPGKRDLIRAGVTACANAIPTPATMAEAINAEEPTTRNRDAVAMAIITSDKVIARCSPIRLATPIPANMAAPIAMTGSIVNREAAANESGISSLIRDRSGPIAAMEGLRFKATSTTPTMRKNAEARDTWACSTECSPQSENQASISGRVTIATQTKIHIAAVNFQNPKSSRSAPQRVPACRDSRAGTRLFHPGYPPAGSSAHGFR
ncbi:hypothetical protein D3C78_1346570 [compost metagenome]